MKSKGRILPLYKKWMAEGRLPARGICNSVEPYDAHYLLTLITPTDDDLDVLEEAGFNSVYWGYDVPYGLLYTYEDTKFGLTPLRQTLLLFMAAENDEL